MYAVGGILLIGEPFVHLTPPRVVRRHSGVHIAELAAEIPYQPAAVSDIRLGVVHVEVARVLVAQPELHPVEGVLHYLHESSRADVRDRSGVEAALGLYHRVNKILVKPVLPGVLLNVAFVAQRVGVTLIISPAEPPRSSQQRRDDHGDHYCREYAPFSAIFCHLPPFSCEITPSAASASCC